MTRHRPARAKKIPVGEKRYEDLTPKQKSLLRASIDVLSMMRNKGYSLSAASATVEISRNTVARYVGSVLVKSKSGRYVAKKTDSLYRRMKIIENGREFPITVRGLDTASMISHYYNKAVRRYLELGDDSELKKLEGVIIVDADGTEHELETDPETIKQMDEKREDREDFDIYDK